MPDTSVSPSRFARLLEDLETLSTAPRWREAPTQAEREAGVANIRSNFVPRRDAMHAELLQLMLDADALGRALVRGGLPTWALRVIPSERVLTTLLAFRGTGVTATEASELRRAHPTLTPRVLRRRLWVTAAAPRGPMSDDRDAVISELLKALDARMEAYQRY